MESEKEITCKAPIPLEFAPGYSLKHMEREIEIVWIGEEKLERGWDYL